MCVYYMTGTPEGFMEKPGIEPATPGLQGIALIHYTTGASLYLAWHSVVINDPLISCLHWFPFYVDSSIRYKITFA